MPTLQQQPEPQSINPTAPDDPALEEWYAKREARRAAISARARMGVEAADVARAVAADIEGVNVLDEIHEWFADVVRRANRGRQQDREATEEARDRHFARQVLGPLYTRVHAGIVRASREPTGGEL